MSKIADIKQIEKKLDKANNLYHNFGDSGMSDAEYDALIDTLRQIDPTNSRFKKVGAKTTKKTKSEAHDRWSKFNHDDFKMGSQNKTTTLDGLTKWANKLDGVDAGWVVQHKLDGTSLKLIYENGQLVIGATRGDGESGEDITKNVLKMSGIPSKIKDKRKIILRGEILLYKSNLEIVGGKNTRNAAAGTAKRFDGVGCEHLNVQVYDVMNWKDLELNTVLESVEFIEKCGFTVVTNYSNLDLSEIQYLKDEYQTSKRDELNWDIDGLVIKPNHLMDDAWDYPDRSIAYKFEAEEKLTKLLDVEWNDTGGRISPTAILEPVDIMGVTISRATLNNIEHIKRLGVKIGDTVVVSRRNDVIPCIEKVSISGKGKEIKAPTHDIEGYPIVREKNSNGEELVYLISTNPNSSSRKCRRILAWYHAHDAKGLGSETIEAIVNADIATNLPEFYDIGLNGDQRLSEIEGFGPGKFKILNKATLLTSKTTLIKFLDGMDMSGFSGNRIEAILEHYNRPMNIKEFLDIAIDVQEISKIQGFGQNTAQALKNAITDVLPVINEMSTKVSIDDWTPAKTTSTRINGLSFCFTGAMTNERSVLEKAVKKHGGVVAGVSKKLDYLVVSNLNWTSTKTQKAESLGIKKINESDFINMIGGDIS